MKSKLFAVLAAGVVLLMVSGPMFAHHDGNGDGVHVYQPARANSF
jgi:hypothetical protein